jgi:hypothetical protein
MSTECAPATESWDVWIGKSASRNLSAKLRLSVSNTIVDESRIFYFLALFWKRSHKYALWGQKTIILSILEPHFKYVNWLLFHKKSFQMLSQDHRFHSACCWSHFTYKIFVTKFQSWLTDTIFRLRIFRSPTDLLSILGLNFFVDMWVSEISDVHRPLRGPEEAAGLWEWASCPAGEGA